MADIHEESDIIDYTKLNVDSQEEYKTILKEVQNLDRKTYDVIFDKVEKLFKTAEIETDKKIRQAVETDKASLITVFGIFASITSFLTIEFQFLKTICSYEKLLGFTLVLFALLLGFNLGLDYLVKSRTQKDVTEPPLTIASYWMKKITAPMQPKEESKPKRSINYLDRYCIFIGVLLLVGIYFASIGNEYKCREDAIHNRYVEEFEERQGEFEEQQRKSLDRIREVESDAIFELKSKIMFLEDELENLKDSLISE